MKLLPYLALIFLPSLLQAKANDLCTAPTRASSMINVLDHGARGDGRTDDTKAIQSAIDRTAGTGGTVFIPNGIYLIDALTSVMLKSDMTLRLSDRAVLKAIPNSARGYSIIMIRKASNSNLIGGILMGERAEHQGEEGEWGMGIYIDGAADILIKGTTVMNTWGDGYYVRGESANIRFCAVTADNNRRQGMSIVSANGVSIHDSLFKNTKGTPPQAGIDIEPNTNDSVRNIRIANSTFLDNSGLGIQVYVVPDSKRLVTAIAIEGNTVVGNHGGGIWIKNSDFNTVTSNKVARNKRFGILLAKDTKGNTVNGNVLGNRKDLVDLGANTLVGNRFD